MPDTSFARSYLIIVAELASSCCAFCALSLARFSIALVRKERCEEMRGVSGGRGRGGGGGGGGGRGGGGGGGGGGGEK